MQSPRFKLLLVVFVFANTAPWLSTSPAAHDSRPNIVWIIPDDMSANTQRLAAPRITPAQLQ
ncbi:MAG: hypothetical protein KDA72_20610 [Planctomycetales bacterium]|nr:hypothetical protein [Planctomycetales bacterium]